LKATVNRCSEAYRWLNVTQKQLIQLWRHCRLQW